MLKIFVNDKNEIHDVGVNSLNDESLHEVRVTDGTFDGWSRAKICCYIATVDAQGHVTMRTPYVDSRLIFHIDQLSRYSEALGDENIEQSEEIENLGDAIIEMSEIVYA